MNYREKVQKTRGNINYREKVSKTRGKIKYRKKSKKLAGNNYREFTLFLFFTCVGLTFEIGKCRILKGLNIL